MSCSKSSSEPVAQWASLPSVAITRIYEQLSTRDRLNASLLNWHWRTNLYQKKFFKDFKFILYVDQKQQWEFFFQKLWTVTSEVILKFNAVNIKHFYYLQRIIIKLCQSDIKGIRFEADLRAQFIMEETNTFQQAYYIYDANHHANHFENVIIEPLRKLFSRRNVSLQVLDFGAIEMLVYHSQDFLEIMPRLNELRELNLCTLRSNVFDFPMINISIPLLTKCSFLQVLSLDYDVLTDNLIQSLQCAPLKKLLVLVHNEGVLDGGVSDAAWFCFASHFQNVDLIFTFIYSQLAVEMMTDRMLRPSMPLTHLRVIFCDHISRTALDWIAATYNTTLKSIHWIDSSTKHSKALLVNSSMYMDPDPFVMMAWRCVHLEEIVIHGYIVDPFNLIGIARLRGNTLKRLEVSLVEHVEWEDFMENYQTQISLQLNYDWQPINANDLHPSLGFMPLSDSYRNEFIYQQMRTDLNS